MKNLLLSVSGTINAGCEELLAYPSWLKVKAVSLEEQGEFEKTLRHAGLNTVCENAICPNLGECFAQKTATFLIMGHICTRRCRFCAVKKGEPLKIDQTEPLRLSNAVKALKLEYVVITSVTRDDLPDGGAAHFASSIEAIRNSNENIPVEVLVPDFQGSRDALTTVAEAGPAVINHNLETVLRLYSKVRIGADYFRSLELLRLAKTIKPQLLTKSGLMLGLGETKREIMKAVFDLKSVGCDLLTIGQYLAPSPEHAPVVHYYSPKEFAAIQKEALSLGFKKVISGPLVRSSYHARDAYNASY